MKLEENKICLPSDMDKDCVTICNILNTLPTVVTVESCCGHYEHPFWVWFHCGSIDVLTRLGRAVSKNYSNGDWEIVVDTSDTDPYGFFWLRSTKTFKNSLEMHDSLDMLCNNILWWFSDKFDEHFKQTKYNKEKWVK